MRSPKPGDYPDKVFARIVSIGIDTLHVRTMNNRFREVVRIAGFDAGDPDPDWPVEITDIRRWHANDSLDWHVRVGFPVLLDFNTGQSQRDEQGRLVAHVWTLDEEELEIAFAELAKAYTLSVGEGLRKLRREHDARFK